MKLLREIYDNDVDKGFEASRNRLYIFRKAARAVLFNEDKKIAIMHVSKLGYYKLPGGGVKEDETITEALRRELKEETGCTADILDELGVIFEARECPEEKSGIIQLSYCFIAQVKKTGDASFTRSEREKGFKLLWLSPDEAEKKVKALKNICCEGRFITARDEAFLKEALTKIENTK